MCPRSLSREGLRAVALISERRSRVTCSVFIQIRYESEREEDAAKRRRKNIEEANGISVPMHRWFFPVLFTPLFFGLFGDFVRETGDRIRIIVSVDSPP